MSDTLVLYQNNNDMFYQNKVQARQDTVYAFLHVRLTDPFSRYDPLFRVRLIGGMFYSDLNARDFPHSLNDHDFPKGRIDKAK